MRHEAAIRRIESFGKRFGPSRSHLYLAYHAAFPLALTPDLLYRIWANFQRDVDRKYLNIPWIAVADILLSNLCDEVGHELYEMDVAVRNELLKRLKEDSRFGEKRINELSNFLLAYVRKDLNSSESDRRDFAQSQRWTALAYKDSEQAARELALAFNEAYQQDRAELVRLATLTETLAQPLRECEKLLIYARAMGHYVRKRLEDAKNQVSGLPIKGRLVSISGVDLPIPLELLNPIESPFKLSSVAVDEKRWMGIKRQALVVGINRYPFLKGANNETLHLNSAAGDAEVIAKILRDYGRFDVKVLPETYAEGTYQVDEKGLVKAETLQDAIYKLFVEPADGVLPQTALLFFAGHGLAIDEYGETVGYLATSETNLERKKWGVQLDWLAKQLDKSKVSEQIVWLDCHHIGGNLNQEIFGPEKRANQDVKRFILTTYQYSEIAYSVDNHGLLTHLLQKALDPERYSVGYDINSWEIQAAIEREFKASPIFKNYPLHPHYLSLGGLIHFWQGMGIKVDNLSPQLSVEPMHLIFIGDRASGKSTLIHELINHVHNKYIQTTNYQNILIFLTNSFNVGVETAPTEELNQFFLDVQFINHENDTNKIVQISLIDAPGENFRPDWQAENPAQWERLLEIFKSGKVMLLILPPYQEILNSEVDRDRFMTVQQWCKRFDVWVKFLQQKCSNVRHILLCLNMADLFCNNLNSESQKLGYNPYNPQEMSWNDRHNYVCNRYFKPIIDQIKIIEKNSPQTSVMCFITSVYNYSLLELPCIYLSSFV